MEEEHTKEPLHNNQEKAANYVKAVDSLLKMFVSDIPGFNRYARQDAYKNFLHTLSQLLSKLDCIFHQYGHRSCTGHNTRQGMCRLS